MTTQRDNDEGRYRVVDPLPNRFKAGPVSVPCGRPANTHVPWGVCDHTNVEANEEIRSTWQSRA